MTSFFQELFTKLLPDLLPTPPIPHLFPPILDH